LLQQQANPPRLVWIEACQAVSGKQCHLTVMDITGCKQAESDRARLELQVQAASEREQRNIGHGLHEDGQGLRAITTLTTPSLLRSKC
jgi:hypothetical protein